MPLQTTRQMSRTPRHRIAVPLALLTVFVALAPGCIERRIRVTSEPPGALVWLNDREIGRTPVETSFTFHGDYDVRLQLQGHEPVHTERRAEAPIYEYPGIDLIASALPIRFNNTIEWHFDLEPSLEMTQDAETFEDGLIDRAEDLRMQAITGVAPAPESRAAE